MPYFYCEEITESADVELSREETQHLSKTLRAKIGDKIELIDGKGIKAIAQIVDLPKNRGNATCAVLNQEIIPVPKKRIHLFVAPPRSNIFAPLIKQCVEMGVWSINLIECDFSVSKPKDKKDAFSKDIIAAAKQSGNTYFPKLSSLKKFSQALNDCEFPIVYGAVPADRGEVSSLPEEGDIALWIGPEGGFSDAELQAIKDKGATGVCIGNWVLRVETAVIALLGVLNQ